MLSAITWDIDPVAIDLGFWKIRWYGICFAATIYTCFGIWRSNAMKYGKDPDYAERFLWYGVLAVVLGARLGHCLFYEPERYLANPIEILYFWKGGLASHGSTVGLFFTVWLFGRHTKTSFVMVGDFLAPGIAFGAGGVRIGNLFNSEIVGRAWEGPWSVIFVRYDQAMGINPPIARHPTALYEVIMGLITFAVLKWLERRDVRNAGSGLQMGVFLIMYFSFRFTVEFFKEYQVKDFISHAEQIRQGAEGFQLTMGQYLSIIPVMLGIFFTIRALQQPKSAWPGPNPWKPEPAPAKAIKHRKKKRK
ncbi:MAG TPA: prolipoprotein diacylglyceryl transferase [Myxococcales bacterium]|nr:prolipoprotein diacylglyceryl transferase [Myxococcales bacterium]HAN31728.1 prolipoprotein diacylglyceryl transferase [Myxococcales bacterium]